MLCLPGECISPETFLPHESPTDYAMPAFKAPHHHLQQVTFINMSLETTTRVLVRHDSIKCPLQQLNDAPCEVVKVLLLGSK